MNYPTNLTYTNNPSTAHWGEKHNNNKHHMLLLHLRWKKVQIQLRKKINVLKQSINEIINEADDQLCFLLKLKYKQKHCMSVIFK